MEQLTLLKTPIKTCALTGHRILGEDFDTAALVCALEILIGEGVDTFYNGLAIGFDLVSAEEIIKLKKKYPFLRLVGCMPFYGQEKNYSADEKRRYAEIVKNCDEIVIFAEHYYKGCFLKRNDYLCERADALLAYQHSEKGGTAYTVKKFKKTGGKIILL